MKQINPIAWAALLAASLILASCATPERTVTHITYNYNAQGAPTTSTLAMTHEVGNQLWIGERHDVASAKVAASDIGKADVVALGGTALVVGGLMSGNLPAASIGAALTAIDAYFNQGSKAAAVGTAVATPTPTPIPIPTTLK